MCSDARRSGHANGDESQVAGPQAARAGSDERSSAARWRSRCRPDRGRVPGARRRQPLPPRLRAAARATRSASASSPRASGMSESNVSHHLSVLRAHGLVRFRREGKQVFYAPDDDHIRLLLDMTLEHVRHGVSGRRPAPARPATRRTGGADGGHDDHGARPARRAAARRRVRRVRRGVRRRAASPARRARRDGRRAARPAARELRQRPAGLRRSHARRAPHRRRRALRRALPARRPRRSATASSSLDPAGADRYEQRLAHVTGLDCADCALKLEGALQHTGRRGERRPRASAPRRSRSCSTPRRSPSTRCSSACAGSATTRSRAGRRASAHARRRRRAASGRGRRAGRRRARCCAGARRADRRLGRRRWPPALPPRLWRPRSRRSLFAAAMVAGGCLTARAAWYSLRARSVDMNVLMTIAAVGAAAIGQWSEAGLVVFLFALGNLLQTLTMDRTRRAVRDLVELAPAEAHVVDGDHTHTVAGRCHPPRRPRAGAARRAPAGRRQRRRRAGRGRPVAGHRRVDAGQQRARRRGVRRLDRAGRRADGARHDDRLRQHHRQDHPPGRRGPGAARAAADHDRPLRGPLHAGGRRRGGRRGAAAAAAVRPALQHLVLPRPRPAHHLLPVRPGDLHAGQLSGGARRRHPARRADQGGRLPRTGRRPAGDGLRQDRHADHRRAAGDRRACRSTATRASGCSLERRPSSARASTRWPGPSSPRRSASRTATAHARRRSDRSAHAQAGGHPLSGDRRPGRARRPRRRDRPRRQARAVRRRRSAARRRRAATACSRPSCAGSSSRARRWSWSARPSGSRAWSRWPTPSAPRRAPPLAALRRRGVRHIALLTGDNQATAAAIGREAGVDEVRAGLLPEEKVAAVRQLAERYGGVAMVGDGVNDAPALAAADGRHRHGRGRRRRRPRDRRHRPHGRRSLGGRRDHPLSRATTSVIRENIALAIAIKAVFLVLAPLGLVTLWMAVFADMGTSLAVIGNENESDRLPSGVAPARRRRSQGVRSRRARAGRSRARECAAHRSVAATRPRRCDRLARGRRTGPRRGRS